MKEMLLQYASYNIWANKRIIGILLKLGHQELGQEIISSFSTVRSTVYHVWSAEHIWLQRLELAERPVWIEDLFGGSFAGACKEWQNVSEGLKEFISKQFDNRSFEHILQYYSRKNQPFKNKVGDVLMHVFNHSTYHRGQVVTMLRQLGITDIPAMDLIAFVRT